METNPLAKLINDLHNEYVRLSGMPARLDLHRRFLWELWLKQGFTGDDLRAVMAYRRKNCTLAGLKFENVVRELTRFEEDLLLVRVQSRERKPCCGRQQVLRATGRADTQPTSVNVRRAGDVARDMIGDPARARAALEELKKMGNNL